MGARKSILITGYSLSDYFAELVDCVIQKSQEGVLVKFFVNDIESQKAFDRLCCYKGKFLRIYNYPKQEDKMSALHAKVISVDQTDTLITCATWILAAIISFISFTAFRWTDKKQGYQLSSFVEKEDASLNFFMTMIIPLLIDDVGTIQGAVTFAFGRVGNEMGR